MPENEKLKCTNYTLNFKLCLFHKNERDANYFSKFLTTRCTKMELIKCTTVAASNLDQ